MDKKKPYLNYDLEDLQNEEWVDVVGYDGIYSVSNLGRIKSEFRYKSNGQRIFSRIMKQTVVLNNFTNIKEPSQALSVSLCVDRVKRTFKVSVLVGQAFIGNPKKGHCYSKKNKVWDDCRASNLEIKTVSDSTKIAYKKGNNLRKKEHLKKNHVPEWEYTMLSTGRKFIGNGELKQAFKKRVKENIDKAIQRKGYAYGSMWKRERINSLPE